MLALPFRCHSLSFKNLCVSHLSLGIGEIRFKVSQTEPHISANVVLRNTKTVHIKQPQIVPSLTGSAEVRDVLSCFSIPFGGEYVILWHTLAIRIHLAQSVLCVRVAALRCLSQPRQRFSKVDPSKPALLTTSTEPNLSSRVAVPGFAQKYFLIGFSPHRQLRRGCRRCLRRPRSLLGRDREWRKQRNDKQREQKLSHMLAARGHLTPKCSRLRSDHLPDAETRHADYPT